MSRSVLLSIATAAGLLALLGVMLPSSAFLPRIETMEPRAAALPQTDRRPLADYASIWERPLFNPGRRKNTAPPSSPDQTLRPLSDYRLVGVVVAKDTKFALIERNDSNQVVTLHVGDDLDGRRVDDIRMDGIALNGSEFLAMPRPARRLKRGRF